MTDNDLKMKVIVIQDDGTSDKNEFTLLAFALGWKKIVAKK